MGAIFSATISTISHYETICICAVNEHNYFADNVYTIYFLYIYCKSSIIVGLFQLIFTFDRRRLVTHAEVGIMD